MQLTFLLDFIHLETLILWSLVTFFPPPVKLSINIHTRDPMGGEGDSGRRSRYFLVVESKRVEQRRSSNKS